MFKNAINCMSYSNVLVLSGKKFDGHATQTAVYQRRTDFLLVRFYSVYLVLNMQKGM